MLEKTRSGIHRATEAQKWLCYISHAVLYFPLILIGVYEVRVSRNFFGFFFRHAERYTLYSSHHFPSRSLSSITAMDRASQVLAESLHSDKSRSYRALAEKSHVPHSTLHHRDRGRGSRETKAQRQQYLTLEEEKAIVNFLLLLSNLGHPVRIKFLPSLAFTIARRRATKNHPVKPPGKNWPRAFEKRHPEIKARRVRAIDWKRHENNIYNKITEWFEVIGQVLQAPAIEPEKLTATRSNGYIEEV